MINPNHAPAISTEPVAMGPEKPALVAQPFDIAPEQEGPWAVEAQSPVAQASTSSLLQESLKAGIPHVDPTQTEILNPGKFRQIINVEIDINAVPADAVGQLRRIDQYQIWLVGKDKNHPNPRTKFSYWGEGGAYTRDEAGTMGISATRPANSPDTALPHGGKALLEMRERIQRLSDKNIVGQAIYWYKIKTGHRPPGHHH